jgi:hypothetical protein
MVILTQIAQKCEILLSPIFGYCLAAYISQKAVNHKSFPSFSLFSFPTSSTTLPVMNLLQQLQVLFLIFCLAAIGTVGVLGLLVLVLVVIFPGESLLLSLLFFQLTFTLLPVLPLVSLFPPSLSF